MTSPEDGDLLDSTEELTSGLATRVVGGKYRLGRLLGEGGMGAVYEAEHLELGVRVAVKLLNYAIADDPRAVARFRREARSTASIKHDNIVQVTDAGADELGPFIVMECLEGESLSSLLHRDHVLAWRLAVGLTKQIVAGLIAAHDHKVIHRDLKPANVLLCPEGAGMRVKLLDFGISKLIRDEGGPVVTTTGEVIGTPLFMSPEQARGQLDVDGRADLYSVGAILYLMVTGRFPHIGTTVEMITKEILAGNVVPPRQHRPDLPEPVERVILKAMALDPKDRYADGRELLTALRDLTDTTGESQPIRPSPSAPQVPLRAPRRRRLATLAIVGATAVAALAVAAWLLFGRVPGLTTTETPIRLGITRHTAEEAIRKEHQPILDYLSAKLGRKVEIVVVDYGLDPGAKLIAGELDVAALSPYVYIRAKAKEPGLRILATPVSHRGGTSYEGLIVARAGSGIHTLEDLKGKPFCYVEENSASGYLYPRALFRHHGIDPDHAFAAVRFKGTHPDTLLALAAGECDGAAVYANVLEDSERIGLTREQFVVLEATPRIPYDAYCVTDRLPRDVADRLQAALLSLGPGSEDARAVFPPKGNYAGFTRAADSDYDRVRAIVKYLEDLAPPAPAAH